jgi:FAD-dependent monooxygenase
LSCNPTITFVPLILQTAVTVRGTVRWLVLQPHNLDTGSHFRPIDPSDGRYPVRLNADDGSPVILTTTNKDDEDQEQPPPWDVTRFVPSTWPGGRAPHVFLKDGQTSIFDLFGTGPEYTLVDFTDKGTYSNLFQSAAKKWHTPLKVVHLPDEDHVRKVWERDAVLVRPDDHVAWHAKKQRGEEGGADVDAEHVLLVSTGREPQHSQWVTNGDASGFKDRDFTSTVGNVDQDKVEMKAAFQK